MHATYEVPLNAYPFAENGEGGTSQWSFGSPWGLVPLSGAESRTGAPTMAWTDSPGANYPANADTTLTTFLNLSGSVSPVLSFWHKYSLEEGKDFLKVEVSTDNGQTWIALRSFTGTETAWNRERINLAAYSGQANLGLRFHLTSDGANQQDGWFMDDLTVREEAVKAAYPFIDDVETDESPWFYTSPWGRTTSDRHGGSYSWTDSPGGSYAAGADNSLQVTIDLGSAVMPVLSFWHKYALETNADYGYVEVREVGTSAWTRLFFVTGTQASWIQSWVDLSSYAGKQIDLRFRIVANTEIQSDGWFIDDIRIGETEKTALAYPFRDDMEDAAKTRSYWHPSAWSLVTDPYNGVQAISDSPQGNYGELVWNELIMAHTLNMTGAVHPQLSFWHKYDIYSADSIYCSGYTPEYDYGRVYVSTGNGQAGSWTQLATFKGSQGV